MIDCLEAGIEKYLAREGGAACIHALRNDSTNERWKREKKKKKNEEGEAMGGGEEASERTEEVLRVAGTSEKETSLPLSILGVARVF